MSLPVGAGGKTHWSSQFRGYHEESRMSREKDVITMQLQMPLEVFTRTGFGGIRWFLAGGSLRGGLKP